MTHIVNLLPYPHGNGIDQQEQFEGKCRIAAKNLFQFRDGCIRQQQTEQLQQGGGLFVDGLFLQYRWPGKEIPLKKVEAEPLAQVKGFAIVDLFRQ